MVVLDHEIGNDSADVGRRGAITITLPQAGRQNPETLGRTWRRCLFLELFSEITIGERMQ